jgi:hypothetical protein
MVQTSLSQLVLKLFWDNEWLAGSNFIFQQRKKSAVVISGEW